MVEVKQCVQLFLRNLCSRRAFLTPHAACLAVCSPPAPFLLPTSSSGWVAARQKRLQKVQCPTCAVSKKRTLDPAVARPASSTAMVSLDSDSICLFSSSVRRPARTYRTLHFSHMAPASVQLT